MWARRRSVALWKKAQMKTREEVEKTRDSGFLSDL